jgi:thiol-disulfide isomerase/thioredoxin
MLVLPLFASLACSDQSGSGGNGHGEAPHVLLGKPAPAINVPLLDGGTLNLADHKGKDVVILDFWATWCGPCIVGMPLVDQVADQYADQNVVFYAVNVGETPEEIKPFMAKQNFDMKVALDANGKVSMDYAAEAIPQTLIIDKNGIVQSVHIGVGADTKAQLERDVKAALAK